MSRCRRIAGVDEAGRGPLAGPVVVAAVVLDPERPIEGLRDSKKLSAERRQALYQQIREHALDFQIAFVHVKTIDRINILQATLLGMRQSVQALKPLPDHVLVDGNRVPDGLPCTADALVGGDDLEPAISAASILAKVARDEWMAALDETYPGYGFGQHRGYGTEAHRLALKQLGPCPEHRRSFAPVAELLAPDLFDGIGAGPEKA